MSRTQNICAYSALAYNVEYMPTGLYLTNGECLHPIFAASYKQLSTLAITYIESDFTSLSKEESYLLYLALFNSTQLIDWRTSALFTPLTSSIIVSNIQKLLSITDQIQHAGTLAASNKFMMPRYVISTDTCTLTNSDYWINNWIDCYKDYINNYKTSILTDKIAQKETLLHAYIKDRTKDISAYASMLANWACLVGNFDSIDCIIADGANNDRPIQLKDYWCRIIKECAQKINIFNIHDGDLSELIDYVETNIDIASSGIIGHTLIALLESVRRTKENYFSVGDITVSESGTVYKILDANESTEDANKIVLIDTAPQRVPTVLEYPNKLAFLRAKLKYDMAQRYAASDAIRNTIIENIDKQVINQVNTNNISDEEL